jgi:hypothetical protein
VSTGFGRWLLKQKGRDDVVGDLADDAARDAELPLDNAYAYIDARVTDPIIKRALHIAFGEYQRAQRTVTLPMKAESTANVREHWGARAARAKKHRSAAALLSKSLTRDVKPALIVTLTRVSPRELDDDNLRSSMKSARDGVAVALRVDDRTPLVEWRYAQRRGEPHENAIEIELSAAPQRSTP